MHPSTSRCWNSVSKLAIRLAAGAALLLGVLLLPQAAQACCTAVLCPYCVNSSNDCVCGANQPVCNVAGCNCNTQCGMYSFNNDGKCYFHSTCDSATAKAGAEKRFSEIDANHDGKINSIELAGWSQKQKTPLAKRVYKPGLPANLQSAGEKDLLGYEFGQMDADKSGFIEPAELDSSLAPASK